MQNFDTLQFINEYGNKLKEISSSKALYKLIKFKKKIPLICTFCIKLKFYK